MDGRSSVDIHTCKQVKALYMDGRKYTTINNKGSPLLPFYTYFIYINVEIKNYKINARIYVFWK